MTLQVIALLLASAALLAAGPAAAQVTPQVTVADAWARASVPNQKTSGAFLRLTSAQDARLVGARSPAAGAVEVHETRMENNIARMRRTAAIDLPAGRVVEFKSGGYHLMLLDLKRPLKPGDTVPITLVIEGKGGQPQTVEVKAAVRPLNAATAHAH